MRCIFCEDIEVNQILLETSNFKVVMDIEPIQKGHLLILSKYHYMDIREIPNSLLIELIKLETRIINLFESMFSVDGVTIIQNNGKIMDEGTHFHVHVVPRYIDDQFYDHQVVINREISMLKLKENLRSLNKI